MNFIKKEVLLNWLASKRYDEISDIEVQNMFLQFGFDEYHHGLENTILDANYEEINDNEITNEFTGDYVVVDSVSSENNNGENNNQKSEGTITLDET